MTAHQLLKIPLDQLRPGMYVNNVFNDRGILLYCANTLISNFAQIEALRRQGVTSLNINIQKGSGKEIASEVPTSTALNEVSFVPELQQRTELFSEAAIEHAQSLRDHAVDSVKTVMASAKAGRAFSLHTVVSSVESIVDSMLPDPELLLNLCRLKQHTTEAYAHSVNVSVLMIGFSSALGFSHDVMLAAGIGGLLHDIGLMALPDDLFMKQGSCSRQEQELFKQHPSLGLDIIKKNRKSLPDGVTAVIGQHHERSNGGGYPGKISGDAIHELSIVCAIADMYDLLTTPGIFNRVYLPQEALALIFQGSDEDFPRSYVEHFTKLLGIYPVGSFVKLDTGEMGVVIKNNRKKLLAPTVRILFDSQGTKLVTPYIKDISISDPQSEDQLARILHSLDPTSFKVDIEQFIIQIHSH